MAGVYFFHCDRGNIVLSMAGVYNSLIAGEYNPPWQGHNYSSLHGRGMIIVLSMAGV